MMDSKRTIIAITSISKEGGRMELTAGQVGLYDRNRNKPISKIKPQLHKGYDLVMGSYQKPTPNGLVNNLFNEKAPRVWPFTRVGIAHAFEAKDSKGEIIYIGYDGVNSCEAIELECGVNYMMDLQMTGGAVKDRIGETFVKERISFTAPCCTDCNYKITSEKVIDLIMSAIDEQTQYFKHFYKVEKITNYCEAQTPFEKKEFHSFEIVVPDEGSAKDLSEINTQYEGKVERISREGINSTYKIITAGSSAVPSVPNAPSDFVKTYVKDTICEDCPDCSSDWVSEPTYYKTIVEVHSKGLDVSTSAAVHTSVASLSIAGYTANTAEHIYSDGSTQVFSIKTNRLAASTDSSIVIKDSTLQGGYCKKTETYSWCKKEDLFKIKREVCVTLPKVGCDSDATVVIGDLTNELTHLLEEYEDVDLTTLAIDKQSECTYSIIVEQYNNDYLQAGCMVLGKEGAKFDFLPLLRDQVWGVCNCADWTFDANGCPVAPTSAISPEGQFGIRLTAYIVDINPSKSPLYSANDYTNNEQSCLELGLFTNQGESFSECSPMQFPINKVQYGSTGRGYGSEFLRHWMLNNMSNDKIPGNLTPESYMELKYNEASSFEMPIDPGKKYHTVTMTAVNEVSAGTHTRNNSPKVIQFICENIEVFQATIKFVEEVLNTEVIKEN